jgi:hypothetical protein
VSFGFPPAQPGYFLSQQLLENIGFYNFFVVVLSDAELLLACAALFGTPNNMSNKSDIL